MVININNIIIEEREGTFGQECIKAHCQVGEDSLESTSVEMF
jgi:hypothetical protein